MSYIFGLAKGVPKRSNFLYNKISEPKVQEQRRQAHAARKGTQKCIESAHYGTASCFEIVEISME